MTAGERPAAHGLALPAGHVVVTVAEDPDVRERLGELAEAVWPEFMLNGLVPNRLWHHLGTTSRSSRWACSTSAASSSPGSTRRRWRGTAPTPDGAIAPVLVDLVADRGVYLDPNVWVVHPIA